MDAQSIRFFEVDGRQVAYSLTGQGPLLVAPAWWVSHLEKDWESPAYRKFWATLSDGFKLLRYDRLGCGLSDSSLAVGLDAEMNVLAALIENMGVEAVNLFGFSFGGPLALKFAATQPSRVERMVLYGTFACGADLAPRSVQSAMIKSVEAHWGLGSRMMADIFAPSADGAEKNALSAASRASCDATTAARFLQLTYQTDVSDAAANVSAQTLILQRKGDRATHHSASKKLASAIQHAELISLEGSDHLPWAGELDVALRANAFFKSGDPSIKAASAVAMPKNSDFFDIGARSIKTGEGDIVLTKLEFGFLDYLRRHQGETVSRDDLLEHVWKQPYGSNNRVDVLVAALRKKLGHLDGIVITVPGHGYRYGEWPSRKDDLINS